MEKRLPAIHPGEVLLEEFMKPLGLIGYSLAKDIGVPSLRINQITRGKRSITADTALRLARYLGTSASVWLRLRARYDLQIAECQIIDFRNAPSALKTSLSVGVHGCPRQRRPRSRRISGRMGLDYTRRRAITAGGRASFLLLPSSIFHLLLASCAPLR